jgi:gamma-glutamyl-gamma-aminobutyrate hydrolase PuuD
MTVRLNLFAREAAHTPKIQVRTSTHKVSESSSSELIAFPGKKAAIIIASQHMQNINTKIRKLVFRFFMAHLCIERTRMALF